jgi:hypothetical protein
MDRQALGLRHAHVERAGEMQRRGVLAPSEKQPVVAPPSGDLDGKLVVACAFENPLVGGDDLFDEIDGIIGSSVAREAGK